MSRNRNRDIQTLDAVQSKIAELRNKYYVTGQPRSYYEEIERQIQIRTQEEIRLKKLLGY